MTLCDATVKEPEEMYPHLHWMKFLAGLVLHETFFIGPIGPIGPTGDSKLDENKLFLNGGLQLELNTAEDFIW